MLTFSILFAIAMPNGNVKGLPLPNWVGYLIIPLAVIGYLYARRKKAEKDDNNDDDKRDE
jgi:hypothetical protein